MVATKKNDTLASLLVFHSKRNKGKNRIYYITFKKENTKKSMLKIKIYIKTTENNIILS